MLRRFFHLAWGFQLPVFAERYRVIAFDNRGAGQTGAPDHAYTTRMMAGDTVRLMDALGIERAHVLGVSMGGMIAQEIALNHPERVRSLQLHCTLGRPDAYLHAQLTVGRIQRRTLTHEEAMRAGYLWLFAPATYNERPEFVEMILQSALAKVIPQLPDLLGDSFAGAEVQFNVNQRPGRPRAGTRRPARVGRPGQPLEWPPRRVD